MGQITLETEFGKKLHELAADPRYKIWLEVGTWDGEGSTLCIVKGLESRSSEDLSGAGLFSIEANKGLWMVGSRYWQEKNPPLRILWGRLGERMMSEEKVRAHPLFEKIKEHFDMYYKSDVEHFVKAPLIRFRRCDVAVLDGGEFGAAGDWDAIRKLKPKVVALDDTSVLKNKDLFDLLFLKTGWKPLMLTSERNGAAILESPGEDERYYPELKESWWPSGPEASGAEKISEPPVEEK